MSLNQEQSNVLEKDSTDAAKVVAGAGTGKTRVLVALYLKLLLEDGIPPGRLLALTFTNKAAAEMKSRVFEKIKAEGNKTHLSGLYDAWIMNFHSFGRRVLTENAPSFGIDPSFNVLGPVDKYRLGRILLKKFEEGSLPGMPEDFGEDMPLPGKIRGMFEDCMEIIDKGRSMMLKPEELARSIKRENHQGYIHFVETVLSVWNAYRTELRRRQLIDFDDMIELVVEGFRQHPEVRERYSNQFDRILVDEFQDTSEAQNELLRLLSGGDFEKITIVGDEKQSIYRWRDARVENIRSFPGKPFVLRRNYRSSQGILDLASRFICLDDYFGEKREDVRLEADRGEKGEPIVVFHPEQKEGKSFEHEAKALVAWIRHLTEGVPVPGMPPLLVPDKDHPPVQFEDIAVLLRSLGEGSGLKEYEDALREFDIPYAVVGGANAAEVKILQLFLSLMSLVIDPRDIHSFLVVLESESFSIGDANLAELFQAAKKKVFSEKETESEAQTDHAEDLSTEILLSGDVLEALGCSESRRRCELLQRLLNGLRQKNAKLDLQTFLTEAMEDGPFFNRLIGSGYTPRLALSLSQELLKEVNELARKNEATLPVFLERIRKMIEEREFGDKYETLLPPACVRIMTIHQAKGLEFRAVAVSGIKPPRRDDARFYLSKTQGLFLKKQEEWGRGFDNLAEREAEIAMLEQEERCLRYVAMTRAKDYLFISSPYPEGLAGSKRSLFADVLECLHAGGIETCELRRAPEVPGPPVRPTEAVKAPAEENILSAAEAWKSARCAVEAAREDLPGRQAAIRFVNWRSLKTFDECPQKHYYRYVVGLGDEFDELEPVPSTDETIEEKGEDARCEYTPKGVEPAAFGIFVHDVLEDLIRLPEKERIVSHSRLKELFDRSGIPSRFGAPTVEAAFKITQAFMQSALAKGDQIECLEKSFAVRSNRIVFCGVFDRVDRTDDGYRVVDYKVGSENKDYEFQVCFYAWALSKIYKGRPVEGAIAYMRENVQMREVHKGAEDLQLMEALAARLEGAADMNRYPATPGEICPFCPYVSFYPHASA